jgi:hypothetical protein
MKKILTWKRMRCVFFLQTSNLQKWKRNTLFLLYKIIIKTETHKTKKKIKLKKKLKHEPNIVEITHLCIRDKVQTSTYL